MLWIWKQTADSSVSEAVNETASYTSSKVMVDGNISKDYSAVNLKAYMVNGNNYFKLRDLGALFDLGVEWDEANNCVLINSENGYTE